MITRKRSNKKKSKKQKQGLLNMTSKAPDQSPEQFAKEMHPTNKIHNDAEIKVRVMQINMSYQRSTETFIRTGELLNTLKEEIAHGKWLALFKGCDKDDIKPAEVQFQFGKRKAQMLMAIAADPFCGNAQNSALLPASWTGLHEAVQKIPKELPRLFGKRAIHDESTHEDIKKVIGQIAGGEKQFDRLRSAIETIISFQKAWPDPAAGADRFYAAFNVVEDEWRISDMDTFANSGAWLTKLHDAVIDEHDKEEGLPDDDGHPPVEPAENPDAEPDVSPEMEELNRPRKPVPENFAAFQQRKRDEQS